MSMVIKEEHYLFTFSLETTSALLWRWLTLRPNWFSFPQMHLLSWNKILLLYNYCKPMEKFKYIFTFKDILSNLKNIDILLNMERTEIIFLTRFSQTNSFRCNSCNINLFPCILLSLISLSYPCILLSFHFSVISLHFIVIILLASDSSSIMSQCNVVYLLSVVVHDQIRSCLPTAC